MADAGIQQRFQGGVKVGRLYGLTEGAVTPLTAHAGGGQTNAVQLKSVVNNFGTVASGADSAKLPPCEAGRIVIVINNAAANAMTVYSEETTGVTINATAGATGVSISAGHTVIFVGAETGTQWNAFGGSTL